MSEELKWPRLMEEYLYGNCEQSAKAVDALNDLETQSVTKDARIAELEAKIDELENQLQEHLKSWGEA